MTTGEKIAYYRELAGLSQVELADKTGTTKQNIWKYENNLVTNIPLDKVEAIGRVLGISPAVLTGWEKPKSEDDELKEYLEELRTRPEMKMLFESSRGMSVDQVRAIVAMIENFKK